MARTIKIFAALLLLGALSLCHAGAGTSALPFLRIAPSARAVGMGETFVAVADDVNATYWNPAGVAKLENMGLSLMHMFYWDSSSYEYLAFAYPLSDTLKLGAHVVYLNYGAMDRTTETSGGAFGAVTGTFSPFDLAFAGTVAYKMNDSLQFGLNVKYAMQTIDTDSASAIAFDGGILYTNEMLLDSIGAKDFTFGAALSNLGGQLNGDSLPMTLRGGFSARFNVQGEKDLLAAVTAYYPFDSGKLSENVGVEYTFEKQFAVRAGYKIGYDAGGLTAGIGYIGALENMFNYTVDYTYAPAGNLGDTHRLSVGLMFDDGGSRASSKGLKKPATKSTIKKFPSYYKK